MAPDEKPNADEGSHTPEAGNDEPAPQEAPSSGSSRKRLKKKGRKQGLGESQAHAAEAENSSAEAGPDAQESDERQDEAPQPADEAVRQGRQEPDEASPESSEQHEQGDAGEGPQESPEQAGEPAQEGNQPEAEGLGETTDTPEEPQAAAEDQDQSPAAAKQASEEATEEPAESEEAADAAAAQDAPAPSAEAEQPDEETDLNGPSLQEILDRQQGHLEEKRARIDQADRDRKARRRELDEAEEPQPSEPAAEDEQPESQPVEEEAAEEQPAESAAKEEADQPSPAQALVAMLAGRPADAGVEALAEPAPLQPDLGDLPAGQAGLSQGAAGGPGQPAPTKRRIGLVGIVLFFNTLLVILVVAVLIGLYLRRGEDLSSVQRAQAIQAEPPPPPPRPAPADVAPPAVLPDPDEAVSWPMAERAFQAKRYAEALLRYRRLLEVSQKVPSEDMVSDFCQLRTAECLSQLGKGAKARELLERVTRSRSPIARGLAWYRLAVADVDGGQLLQARMKAYQALAVLGALADAGAVEADCDYLICRALTVEALSSHNLDVGVDWGAAEHADPFAGLDEPALRELLRQGAHQLAQAFLRPQVRKVESDAPAQRLAASCSHSPLEELLQRMATEASEDVRWKSVDPKARRRMVAACFHSVSAQRLSEVACGSAGLVARFTGEQIHIHDLQSAASLADQRELILREAESAWRRFFLRAPKDPRIARGRFALANLCEAAGNPLGAIREYQLVAHRFSADPVAPEALLRSAQARTAIRDYVGARKDLLGLLDRYPGHQSSDKAYICLGQATMNSGLHEKAVRVFSKLYHLNLTPASRREASFGAGKCLYLKGEYKEASKWLARYIRLVKSPSSQLAEAYCLLARSESRQGNLDGAVQALHAALAAKPPAKRRAEALMELARTEAKRQRFVPAVTALGRIEQEHLDEEQLPEFLLLNSQIYRSMGLAEKALSLLRREIEAISDPQTRAELEVELARCHADSGELKAARELLTKTLPALKPGPKAHLAACELAQMCLADGQPAQAVTVTRELLESSCQPDIRKRAQLTLGAAYLALKDYERAALALSGMAVKRSGAKDK